MKADLFLAVLLIALGVGTINLAISKASATTIPFVTPTNPTMRIFKCDPGRRAGHPHGNTLKTDRATLIINESLCRTA